jgi:error-prone DNA polymerase
MGFYQSHTLLYDATRKGCTLLPIDICFSEWDNTLTGPKTIRLGFREIHGLRKTVSERIISLRNQKTFVDFSDFIHRLKEALHPDVLTKRDLFFLASADAFQKIQMNRRQAFWRIRALNLKDSLSMNSQDELSALSDENSREKVSLDFQATGVSLFAHPMSCLKKERQHLRALDTQKLKESRNGEKVRHAGMVVSRQMPPTANGVMFITLEDEWGLSNLILWKETAQRYENLIWSASFLAVEGTVQKDKKSPITHLIVNSVEQLELN